MLAKFRMMDDKGDQAGVSVCLMAVQKGSWLMEASSC